MLLHEKDFLSSYKKLVSVICYPWSEEAFPKARDIETQRLKLGLY